MTRRWSLLTAVLIVAIFAASWYLLIAPKRSEAADLRATTTAQEQANAQLVQKLAELKAQSLDLPKQRATLAVMRKQVPDNPALPSMIRDLTAVAKKTGVNLESLAPTAPAAVTPAGAAPVAATPPPPVEGTSETDSKDAATATDAASDGATATTGATGAATTPAAPAPALYQVPLKLKVSGSYFQLEQFINELEGLRRSFLVTGFSLKPGSGAAAGATPAATTATTTAATTATTTAAGDGLTLDLDGRVYLSPPAVATAATPTPVSSPATGTTGQ